MLGLVARACLVPNPVCARARRVERNVQGEHRARAPHLLEPAHAGIERRLPAARDTDVTAPIRQHHGQADDYVTVAPCRPYFERLRAAGRDAQLIEYPDAHHAYDNPLGAKTPTIAKGSQSTRA